MTWHSGKEKKNWQNTAHINQLTKKVMFFVPIYLWIISNPVHESFIKYTIDQANQNTCTIQGDSRLCYSYKLNSPALCYRLFKHFVIFSTIFPVLLLAYLDNMTFTFNFRSLYFSLLKKNWSCASSFIRVFNSMSNCTFLWVRNLSIFIHP